MEYETKQSTAIEVEERHIILIIYFSHKSSDVNLHLSKSAGTKRLPKEIDKRKHSPHIIKGLRTFNNLLARRLTGFSHKKTSL